MCLLKSLIVCTRQVVSLEIHFSRIILFTSLVSLTLGGSIQFWEDTQSIQSIAANRGAIVSSQSGSNPGCDAIPRRVVFLWSSHCSHELPPKCDCRVSYGEGWMKRSFPALIFMRMQRCFFWRWLSQNQGFFTFLFSSLFPYHFTLSLSLQISILPSFKTIKYLSPLFIFSNVSYALT